MRAAALAGAMLALGLILGGLVGFSSGGGRTLTFTTTAVIPTTVITTEARLTTVEVVRTQLTTSITTVTQTVTAFPMPMIGETYSLKVIDVVVDRVVDIAHDYYIFLLEASYKGSKSWNFNMFYLNLVSDKGYKYSIALSLAARQYLGAIELKDGEIAKGQVSFKLPKGEVPSKLIYEDKLRGIKIEINDIPPPSRQVSWIYFAETTILTGYSVIWASAMVETPGAYYSGEDVNVELRVKYLRIIGNPDSITVTSIMVDKFEIVRMDPRLPISLKDGEEVTIKMVLRVPLEGYKGNLRITIKT